MHWAVRVERRGGLVHPPGNRTPETTRNFSIRLKAAGSTPAAPAQPAGPPRAAARPAPARRQTLGRETAMAVLQRHGLPQAVHQGIRAARRLDGHPTLWVPRPRFAPFLSLTRQFGSKPICHSGSRRGRESSATRLNWPNAACRHRRLMAGSVSTRPRQEADRRPRCCGAPPYLTGSFRAARRTHSPGQRLPKSWLQSSRQRSARRTA